jgi:hypothetical protein
MIPTSFAAPRVLRRLNVAAVALSLSAMTAAIFGAMSHEFSGLVTGVPTLLVGLVWAFVLRIPATVGRSKVRWGWLASVPLAALNGGLAAGALLSQSEHGPFVGTFFAGLALGSTIGVFFWGPALVLTLLAFGLPMAWAQSLAKKGLAGEERGERIVGAVCMVLAYAALMLTFFQDRGPSSEFSEWESRRIAIEYAGHVFMRIAAVLGLVLGSVATALATLRERQRRTFVSDVEAGKVRGFRVDATPEGKALVRVSSLGQGYRVADFSEEVFLLDEHGEATESRMAETLPGR